MTRFIKCLPAILGAGLIFAAPAHAKAPAAPRNYDCTKAGNKNKAVCETAATASAASATPAKTAAPAAASVSKPAAAHIVGTTLFIDGA
ncbi:MAG: hypothetical protein J7498_12680 [Sphingobium sp.]|nr:hypothetical protein [Sphingobium sp.]